MAHQAATTGAQRGAHRDFALSRSTTCQREVGNIGTRYYQDQTDRTQEHEQRRLSVTYHKSVARLDEDSVSLVPVRRGLIYASGQRRHLDLRVFDRNVSSQSPNHGQEIGVSLHALGISLEGNPEL